VATLKEIRKRLASAKNTKKITYAMKLVAGARLKKAQDAILAARPYADKIHEVISELAIRAEEDVHPLLEIHDPVEHILVLVVTSDRGLCGGFNANIIRQTEAFLVENRERYDDIKLAMVGRKGNDYFKRRDMVDRYFPDVFLELELERAREIGDGIIEEYTTHDLDQVLVIYNEFKSAISQRVVVERLLPMATLEEREISRRVDFIYEPTRPKLLDQLIPRYIHATLYRALLESYAAEMGARMTAMENATNNATELIDHLTLMRNRLRQQAITTELTEITSGAEALKG
jgi:F-type H+-transporting ATPase subunit gamma